MWYWVDWLYYCKWYLILLQIFIVFLTALCFSAKELSKRMENKKILLVTAHPDDEVMFFTPFLSNFNHLEITLLCLSNGNSAGLGKVREKELEQAVRFLKIAHLELIENPALEDGMSKNWQSNEINSVIVKTIEKYQPNVILTFDIAGVSRHPNHVAIRRALSFIKVKHQKSVKDIEFWELQSTGFLRKYIGIIDVIFSSRSDFAVFNPNPFLVWQAMSLHRSQFVWYRKLFVVFSRFAYLNTLKQF